MPLTGVNTLPIGMPHKKGVDLRGVFLGQERARGIDQPSALGHERLGLVKDLRLDRQQRQEIALVKTPLRVRRAPPCAAPRTRHIAEHKVIRGLALYL